MSDPSPAPGDLAQLLHQRLPEGGLFDGKSWLVSPEPYPLSAAEHDQLVRLGPVLRRFQETCDLLHRRSRLGRIAPWLHPLLDAGKPADLLAAANSPHWEDQLPAVLRPDLLVTEAGFKMTELDSVPGGIGLTGFLNQFYADESPTPPIGGAAGMVDGFRSIVPDEADIVVSEESADYRPEMEWLADQLNPAGVDEDNAEAPYSTHPAEDYRPSADRSIYRFFELFDLANIPFASDPGALDGLSMSPPPRPVFEEKLWLALFWNRTLREHWERALRRSNMELLQEIIPYSWVVDPTPIPPHGSLPRLDANSWDDVAEFSKGERPFVLKISGFSEEAWGSRGVYVGQDMSNPDWKAAVANAVGSFSDSPYIMQDFAPARLVEHPFLDPESGEIVTMTGRVRLCPYYFVPKGGGEVSLGGVLATIVPADKKIVHGMSDAIITTCRVE